jgi:pilus assembly protein CpaC
LPVIGALFRSTSYQRNETELVLIVTPYLVKPSSRQLALPTDGYRAPNDIERNFLGQSYSGKSGVREPTAVQAVPAAPVTGAAVTTAAPAPGFNL